VLPVRVSETGELLTPSGIDPYTLPWVEGASNTVHGATRRAYPAQLRDLVEKRAVLRAKRPEDFEDRAEFVRHMQRIERDVLARETVPTYGPRRRPRDFALMQDNPPGEDGRA